MASKRLILVGKQMQLLLLAVVEFDRLKGIVKGKLLDPLVRANVLAERKR